MTTTDPLSASASASDSDSAGAASFAAVDLGASSGRVMRGLVGPGTLELTELHRFPNVPVRLDGGLHWDVPGLYQEVLDGLRAVARAGGTASVGIDTWAVDYGLLDASGSLIGLPFHYRDDRTAAVAEEVRDAVGPEALYAATGLQHLPFNTLYQLAAERGTARAARARTLLLMPDLITHWLTGSIGAEATNASTTGLLDARAGTWSPDLARRAGADPGLLPPLRAPGDPAGTLLARVAEYTGLPEATPVTAVASHDTASAVAAVPAAGTGFAYISCGTWSLAGLELDAPVLTEESRAANFTNERGVDGTVRYLRNIMGLWLVEECRRAWERRGRPMPLPRLLDEAARARPLAAVIDPDAPEFLPPGDMPARIAAHCVRTGQDPPRSPGAVIRCVLESLALAHRRTLADAARLADREITRIHLVGGGSRNELLCRLTADATGIPVLAGPTEATALGNVLVQARAFGLVGDLPGMRRLVAATQPVRRHTPDPASAAAWAEAATRIRSISEGSPVKQAEQNS